MIESLLQVVVLKCLHKTIIMPDVPKQAGEILKAAEARTAGTVGKQSCPCLQCTAAKTDCHIHENMAAEFRG